MKYAVPVSGGVLSSHFGHCEQFELIEVDPERKVIASRETLAAPPHEPGLLPRWLAEKGAEMIIAGGMGMRASGFFEELGIKAIVGVSGKVDDIISKILKGELKGGESLCKPGAGKGYGIEKTECDHPEEDTHQH